MLKLKLNRPLAFIDLETTGLNLGVDRIVEISILKVLPDGKEEIRTSRVNPQMHIPIEASRIHGIYNKDVENAPAFKDISQQLIDFLADCDIAGYNSNKFDIPMLMEEFLRVGESFNLENRRFVDVQNIFHQMEQRTLEAAYRFYCGKEVKKAHSAEEDIRATYEILLAQLEKYQDKEWKDKHGQVSKPVQNDVDALHKFTNLHHVVDFAGRIVFNERGEEVFNFGKHKGKCVEEVFRTEPSYYAWMRQGDFPLHTKHCIEKIWIRFNDKNKKLTIKQRTEVTLDIEEEKMGLKPLKSEARAIKSEPVTPDMLELLKTKFNKNN